MKYPKNQEKKQQSDNTIEQNPRRKRYNEDLTLRNRKKGIRKQNPARVLVAARVSISGNKDKRSRLIYGDVYGPGL